MGDKLTQLVLKVAKELEYCYPGNKVMIFTVDDEGEPNEQVNFKMIDIDEEWVLSNHKAEYLSGMPDRHSPLKAAVSSLVH